MLAILSFLRAGRAEERAKNAEHRAERAERREEERHARDDQRFEREHRDERIAALERVAEHLREVQAAFDAGIGGDVIGSEIRAASNVVWLEVWTAVSASERCGLRASLAVAGRPEKDISPDCTATAEVR